MYNEELKVKFIRGYTRSINTAAVAETLFKVTQKYEEAWQADLCTRTQEELQPVIDEIVGLRSKSKWMSLIMLKEYVRWCMVMRVPDACEGMLEIDTVGLGKLRRQMVANPAHLQKYMDSVFDPESKETIHNIYRCYLWMAYGGIEEEDTLLVKNEDVDLGQMLIRYRNTTVPIYREAIPAFRNALYLNDFLYDHPKYDKAIRRDRIPGDTVMRGIKALTKTYTIRSVLSKLNMAALEEGETDLNLSFTRIKLSGLFYRMLESEQAKLPMSFSDAADRVMEGKQYTLNHGMTLEKRKKIIMKDFMEDYQRWKLAFSV